MFTYVNLIHLPTTAGEDEWTALQIDDIGLKWLYKYHMK